MRRQLARFAAVDRQQVDLRELVVAALGGERDCPAIWGPARSGFTVCSPRELYRWSAVNGRAPDVRDPAADLPVGFAAGVDDILARRRQLRVGEPRRLSRSTIPMGRGVCVRTAVAAARTMMAAPIGMRQLRVVM
jgi:hypothetical protein